MMSHLFPHGASLRIVISDIIISDNIYEIFNDDKIYCMVEVFWKLNLIKTREHLIILVYFVVHIRSTLMSAKLNTKL